MKNKKALLLVAVFITPALFACRVDVPNNLAVPVLIEDKKSEDVKIIQPGQSEFVGSEHERPNIILYIQEPNGIFKKRFHVEMIGCASIKKVVLTIKDIVDGTYNKELFKATPHTKNIQKPVMQNPEPMNHNHH